MQWAKPWTWALAAAISLALFALVATQLDAASLAAVAASLSWPLVAAGTALLLVAHLADSVRMHLIAGRDAFTTAIRVTAWHTLWLLALPMRLGEVVWVVAMRKAYGWNPATAVVCALVQRLLDLAVVAALLLLAMPAVLGLGQDGAPLAAAAVAACAAALAGVMTLRFWLRLTARLMIATGRPRGWRLRLLRHLRQGRRWLESVQHRRTLRWCLVPTVLAWTAVFSSYWLLGQAVGLQVAAVEVLFAGAGSVVITSLPVQSIGGVGLLEVGLTGILAWFGAPADTAAVAALTIRFAYWAATGMFWLLSLSTGLGRHGADTSSRPGAGRGHGHDRPQRRVPDLGGESRRFAARAPEPRRRSLRGAGAAQLTTLTGDRSPCGRRRRNSIR